eukprot:g21990.t1
MLVAIEGIDGSGKGTQAARLRDGLVASGLSCRLISFPRYDATLFGRAVGDFLNGRFGTLDQVDPHLAALLYAGDRFESRDVIIAAAEESDVVVFDRFVASNIAHQGAKVAPEQRQETADWIANIEYGIYGLPRADLTILLDLPAEHATELIARKSARNYTDLKADLQEADSAYLAAVRDCYLKLSETEPHWQRIDVVRDTELRTIDDIAAEIRETESNLQEGTKMKLNSRSRSAFRAMGVGLLSISAVVVAMTQDCAAQKKVARTDGADSKHALAPAIRMARESARTLDKIDNYTALFRKMEIVNGKAFSHVMQMKFRKKPFSVYLRFVGENDGQEVIYVDGQNGGNLLAHAGGVKRLAGTLKMKPNSERAMREGRYPITRIGISKMIEAIITQWEDDLKPGRFSDFSRSGLGSNMLADTASETRIAEDITSVRAIVAEARRAGKTIGLVPTMGALHSGHISLVEAARRETDEVIVSIFVNPTQFGPHEDFQQYPRTLEDDVATLEAAGVAAVFHPDVDTLYPEGFQTFVDVEGLSNVLEGAFRPGHFRGVATIVLKLLNIVQPDVAFFGRKDYQQQALIRTMCRDLDMPTEIRVCPTIREPDGLALSSRNAYLNPEERQSALALSESLRLAESMLAGGETRLDEVRRAMRSLLEKTPLVTVDYATVADAVTLDEVAEPTAEMIALVAARVGTTRLIDNLPVLFRIPIDGPLSLGPLGEFPLFGFGIALVVWCILGGYRLYAHRNELALDKHLAFALAGWAAFAAAIIFLPQIAQRGARQTIADATAAVEQLKPDDPAYRTAFEARDLAWRELRESDKAIAANEEEIQKRPTDPQPHLLLAWNLATSPNAADRDPKRAIASAQKAIELIERQVPKHSQSAAGLDVLAAAYAANGEYDEAQKAAKRAAEHAASVRSNESDDIGQLIAIRQRLERYRNEQPYRDVYAGISVPVYGYGLMLFLGFASAGWMAIRRGSWVGISKDTIWDVSLWVLVGGIGGARLFYVIQYRDSVFKGKSTIGEYAMAIVNLREGGLVLYGGVIVALTAYLIFCARRKLNILLMSDVVIPSFFIGLAFGRLGCFMNGCCYGDRCELPWAVRFPLGSVPDMALVNQGVVQAGDLFTLQLHPSQLYSSLNALILALLTHMYFRVRRRDGSVLCLALLTYPISRFLIEYLRGDEMGKFNTSLTISQIVSIVLFGVGVAFCFWLSRQDATVTPVDIATTMNEKNPDILISAYFDGELTPTEREMVEQHLAASPEAQQELDTFGELHALLQSLPHETLSDDFTAEVLQKAERASLLPAAEPTMLQQQPERAPKPRLFVVGSLIATAAALLLMTKLLTSTQPRSTNERSIASKSDSDQNVALVEKAERSRAAGNSTNPPMSDARSARSNIERKGLGQTESMRFKTESAPSGANPPESIRSSKKNFAKESFDSKKKSGVAGIRAKNNPAPPGKVAAGAKAAEGNNLRLLIQRNANRDAIRREVLRKLQKGMIRIGDVVPYFENRGDRTAVVEVVVVDVQKTVNDFQLLLVENAVPAADDNDPRNKKKDQKARKTLPEDGKQMIALYVESSQVQMTTAMKWLTRDSENRQIVLKPPIELDNILLADSGQWRVRPMAWENVAAVADFDHGPVVFKKSPKQIAVFRTRDAYYAVDNRCPHEGYPLAEGSVDDDCLLTCNWHNWKFQLSDGKCILGGDHVRTYPAEERDGRVWIDVDDPPPEVVRDSILEGLKTAFDERDFGRICREVSRLHFQGLDPLVAVRRAIEWSYDRFEYGTTHAYAAAADWLSEAQRYAGDWERRLVCLAEPIDHMAFDALRYPAFRFAEPGAAFEPFAFADAVEREDRLAAEGMIRRGLDDGLHWHDVEPALAAAALAHFNDFGHSLIYVCKTAQLLEHVGTECERFLILPLVRHLCYTTREDLLPEFRAYGDSLAELDKSPPQTAAEPVSKLPFPATTAEALGWIKLHFTPKRPEQVYDRILEALARNLLHYDTAFQDAYDNPVSDNVGWLGFTHGITFANAVRTICTRYPQLWPQGLLQLGCMLGRNRHYLKLDLDVSDWEVDDESAFLAATRESLLDHGLRDPIFSSHLLKTTLAVADELPTASESCRSMLLAGLNRFLHSPLKQKHARRLARQAIALALDRVLAEDVVSAVDVAGFDRSNVDGFAVRAEDTFGAMEEDPRCVVLNDEVLAPGVEPQTPVGAGTATAIATGGMVPRGADAVVMIEDTELLQTGDSRHLQIARAVSPGQNVTFAGTDIANGETILRTGRRLTSREIGVAAAIGLAELPVFKRPRVAVISTGNEIVPPGGPRPAGFVYDSNLAIISAAVRELGGVAVPLGVVRDDEAQLDAFLKQALECDVVVLSGGTSKGAGDLSYQAVSRLTDPGIVVHGVALKPGKPVCLAATGGKPVVVLPGFPTSAIFTFHEFVAPVIRTLGGRREESLELVSARLPLKVNSERGRTEYLLVGLVVGDELPAAYPMGKGSGSVTTFSTADGFITIDAHTEILDADTIVDVRLLSRRIETADLIAIGSHCLGLDYLLGELERDGLTTKVMHVGSTGGLSAAQRGECDIAGVHLLDAKTGEYNRPFLTDGLELVPGYTRMQGILYRPGDTRFDFRSADEAVAAALGDSEIRMINRNAGSGTRILIDRLLDGRRPPGYAVQAKSHNAIAAAIHQKRADWGVGIKSVAELYGLKFLPIGEEEYDFVVPAPRRNRPGVIAFLELLQTERVREKLAEMGFRVKEARSAD